MTRGAWALCSRRHLPSPPPMKSLPAESGSLEAAPPPREVDCILVLQGGGALGAYQAGVFESLCEAYREPTWVAGISIGAINAALIAGNPPGQRLARLRAFWERITTGPAWPVADPQTNGRNLFNEASATRALLCGAPGFFSPRIPAPSFQPRGTPGAISWYDTAPLRATLESLIDFDRLNDGGVRLSVGAVNVRTGNFEYFDTEQTRLDVRHVMASGALPPGFPPVEIDGEFYWDGGLVSNTPLQHVLDQPGRRHRVVFQVDLFPAVGALPETLFEVDEREKDIRFSSRTRLNTRQEVERQQIAQAARRLIARLPPGLRDDPDVQALAALRPELGLDIVHLIYRSKHYESQSKDYDFSRLSMDEHWASGRDDMARTLQHPDWTGRAPAADGIRVFDLASAT